MRACDPVCRDPGLGRVETDRVDTTDAPVIIEDIYGHGQGLVLAEGPKSQSPIAECLFMDGQAFDADANPIGVDPVSTLDVDL